MLLYRAKSIVLHGFFYGWKHSLFWIANISLIKKSTWVIWGSDLYLRLINLKKNENRFSHGLMSLIVRSFRNISCYIPGDYKLAKQTYKTKAKYIKTFYNNPVNWKLLDEMNGKKAQSSRVLFLVGNCADSASKHIEIFHKLSRYKEENIGVISPLSYGDAEYGKTVANAGYSIFGQKFTPIFELLSPEEYAKLLASIDVAVFNHDRQRALGNIISLLYLRKKVYIKNDISLWRYFEDISIKVFNTYDIEKDSFLSLQSMEDEIRQSNRVIIYNDLSDEKCVSYWKTIFDDL